MNRISPLYLHGIFSFAIDVTGHSGRNVHRFFPRVRTNYGKQSLAYSIWNRLSDALYGVKTLRNCIIICNFYACMLSFLCVCCS